MSNFGGGGFGGGSGGGSGSGIGSGIGAGMGGGGGFKSFYKGLGSGKLGRRAMPKLPHMGIPTLRKTLRVTRKTGQKRIGKI